MACRKPDAIRMERTATLELFSTRLRNVSGARIQQTCAVIFAVFTIMAFVLPVWIEEVTSLSPDGGSGELALLLAVPFGLLSVVYGALTWRSLRQLDAMRQSQ